jgi:hypothetical protein
MTPEVKLNIAPNVSAMVASTIANDVFMSALLFNAQPS